MDARDTLPLIERAFAANSVDDIITLVDVLDAFGLDERASKLANSYPHFSSIASGLHSPRSQAERHPSIIAMHEV